MFRSFFASSVLLASCGGAGGDSDGDGPGPADGGVAVLGAGTHSLDAVDVTIIGTAGADELDGPSDLAFHPDVPDELWVVNEPDESITIFHEVGSADQTSSFAQHATSEHFLSFPSGIAFGSNGNFATIHDKYEPTQGGATGADFMGPTLWSGESDSFDGGDESHLDMLHNSPKGKGIAWERQNRYWVFDGLHDSITLYDFHEDHGLGGTQHNDGEVARYVEGELKSSPAVPSHLDLDHETGLLYVADTGNSRVAVLDTATGERGAPVTPNYDGTDQYYMDGAVLETLVDDGLEKPVGLALHDGLVFVSDADAPALLAFDIDDGELVDWLELDRVVHGITFDDDGALYAVASDDGEVIRISGAE
jgi:DNA-binding beta-propeller fold protein YncE